MFAFLQIMLTCGAEQQPSTQIAFYHWQTQMELSEAKKTYLDSLGCKKLYVKFFDVDRSVPSATLIWTPTELDVYEIVPTIFITNRTLKDLSEQSLQELAQNIASRILTLAKGHTFSEIQLDCDWTATTQQPYFELLQLLKNQFPNVILSSTIRLHQVKYFETTGVPPVDKGMLMCYNVGELDNWNTENSILDIKILTTYLHNFDRYPLKLDIALPLFQWGVIFRGVQLFRLVNNLSANDLKDESKFQKLNEMRFKVLQNTYLKGHYLYEGDRIRLENVTTEQLATTAQLLSKALPSSDLIITYYHLNETIRNNYSAQSLITISKFFDK